MKRGRPKLKIEAPIVLVFKNTAKSIIKIKMIENLELEEILDPERKIPGISDNAEILEIGVGQNFYKKLKEEYEIK